MEGNQMKMREAIVAFVRAYEMDNELDNIEATSEAYEKARAAISIPPRNCDVGTVEEQMNRFREFCETEKCERYRCRSGCKATCIDRCAIVWAQMPYDAQEGGAK